MATKKSTGLNINLGKVLEVAENSLEYLFVASEKQLERWLDSPQKPKHHTAPHLAKKEKEGRKELREIAKAQDFCIEMNSTNTKNQNVIMTERLSELESQDQETSQELDRS